MNERPTSAANETEAHRYLRQECERSARKVGAAVAERFAFEAEVGSAPELASTGALRRWRDLMEAARDRGME